MFSEAKQNKLKELDIYTFTYYRQAPMLIVREIVKRLLSAFMLSTEDSEIVICLRLLYKPTFLQITYTIHINQKITVISLVIFISFFLMPHQ